MHDHVPAEFLAPVVVRVFRLDDELESDILRIGKPFVDDLLDLRTFVLCFDVAMNLRLVVSPFHMRVGIALSTHDCRREGHQQYTERQQE
ncbi:hypothetical protein ER308_18030 [Egibacter rhizosphaerae]|uniref:Uncharacterized protein n=1 Tax=Egibacter rhizosphaerae TaxID=1670831 RepID=A0A411YJI5_9ACTN|nr:hypothetical protein ER308_18030 [Egibacter rhizosphaerae]